jgi:monovalent cation:H+ antiporter-2, CPA2 family
LTSEPHLLITLVLAMSAAVFSAFIALRLHQSVLVGYLVAGVIIGPNSPGFVGDINVVQQLAEIGVILLMFSVGLEISFKDLLRSGPVALVGANLQVAIIIGLGYLVGIAMGWKPMEALFFGAVVSNSSSILVIKILGERGELDTQYGHLTLAWLAVQDLGTVLLVVVLSALSGHSDGMAQGLLGAIGKAALFLGVAGPLAALVFPRLFERVAALHSRELFVLTVTLVALGTAYASTFFGLSLALGAFVAGVVVGESDLSHQILGDVVPIRDVFAGLFFVSVGMLVNPAAAAQNPIPVIMTVALIVVAKGTVSALIALLFRYPKQTALRSSVSLAQSAEFSFLLANLGLGLGAISLDSFSLMMAGIVITIALSPLLNGVASRQAGKLERHFGESALSSLPATANEGKELRGHAIICGYGRVGRIVAGALTQRGLPFVVIGEDPRLVRRLRAHGIRALLGNAANPVLLDHAGLARARVLVVAIPHALEVRQIVDYARRENPVLDIVVRTHSWTERDFMLDRGIGEVVVGELELALEMTRHTLHRFGVSTLEAQSAVQGLRHRVEMDPHTEILEYDE